MDTLLIVDDTPANLNVLFDFLNEAGFKVLVANNGKRGIQKVEYARPDLILLDIMMPGMDGFEVCRILKARTDTRDIPIVFMTALADTVDKVKGLQLGAADYITKPFEQEEVLARINTHLHLRKLQVQLEEKQQELEVKNRQLEEQNQSLVALSHVLQTAKLSAEEANTAKSALLAEMGHELRAPMNAIIGYSDLLGQADSEDIPPTGLARDLQRINAAGTHLLGLINEVLDFSKIEAGKMTVHPETVTVAEICEAVEATAKPLADKQHNRLTLSCPHALGSFYNDGMKIRQILINLMSNACKFTEQGEITLTVEKSCEDDREMLIFQVRDTGKGLSPAQLARIFQPFVQADADAARTGSGLGLAITKRLAELLGGDISADSTVGQGSVFTVRLPAVFPDGTEKNLEGATAPAQGTVLVVDDDPAVCGVIQHHVNQLGYQAVVARGGPEALKLAKELKPDLITLDVMMPYMDGWSVLLALKQDPALKDIHVLMLSMMEEDESGYSVSAAGYLMKPIDHEQLAEVLNQYAPVDETRSPFALVVEDDPDSGDLLARLLTKAGWRSVLAQNGKVALNQLARMKNRPDVIFSDLMMPEMNGFEFIEILRATPDYSMIPVVVLTAENLNDEERARLNESVVRIFQKGSHERAQLLENVEASLQAALAKKHPDFLCP